MKNIIKATHLKSLLLLIFVIQTLRAASFYDLSEGIVCTHDSSKTSQTKNVRMVSENYQFSPKFLEQTRDMMKREALFRDKCGIAKGTNVAQLCIYGAYSDKSEWKVLESFDAKKRCRGHFYLSGNDPVSIQNATRDEKGNSTGSVNVQKVGHDTEGYIEIRQRPQPLLATIQETVHFLEKIVEFVEDPERQTQVLVDQAKEKQREINAIIAKKDEIIGCLRKEVTHQLNGHADVAASIASGARKCMVGVLNELMTCLEGDDFSFHGLRDTRYNENVRELIELIIRELSSRNLGDILNSKFFNLGCSEPLLLYDLLRNGDLKRTNLIRRVHENLIKDQQPNHIVVQLHSTKTPCKSCLISCCGHFQKGVIRDFFKEIEALLSGRNVRLSFVISYQSLYEDQYPFKIPIMSDVSLRSDSIMLVNMQFYDAEFQKMKQRIIKEEHLRIKAHLLESGRQRESTDGSLNDDDL